MRTTAHVLLLAALALVLLVAIHVVYLVRDDVERHDEPGVDFTTQPAAPPSRQENTSIAKPSPAAAPVAAEHESVVPATDAEAAAAAVEAQNAVTTPAVVQTTPAPVRIPRSVTRTVSFMPGQAVNIPNHLARKTEIHSEFPLRIFTGTCHSDYTVQFFCDGDPADLFIVDVRPRPIFRMPRANQVTITFTEF